MKIGQKFNNWEIISIDYEKDSRYHKHYLCYSEVTNNLQYVRRYNLINGNSTGRSHLGNCGGHSTRYKQLDLPKYVYTFPHKTCKYRVCKKIKGTNKTFTYKYFNKVEDAEQFVQVNNIG